MPSGLACRLVLCETVPVAESQIVSEEVHLIYSAEVHRGVLPCHGVC